jgi:predicted amidophosphoribosyltransferase
MPPAPVNRWLAQQYGTATAQFHTRILNAWNSAGNLLFPPACVFCGVEMPASVSGEPMLCARCHSRIIPSDRSACRRCASALPAFWPDDQGCPRCKNRRYHFSQSVALGSYHAELQQVVLRMKRPAYEPLTRTMGLYLAELVRDRFGGLDVDLIVPIPMHWWRRLRRGTYPAQLLATTVGTVVRLPVYTQLLSCRRKAKKQGTLRPTERFKNVRGTFCVSSGYAITDANVLIVDDSEAAHVLHQAGARTVYVAVVARGGK